MRAAVLAACFIGIALAGSPRLPRTSADQRSIRNAHVNNNITNSLSAPTRGTLRSREQYLFNVFEVIVSTLESKLQRIENLDKAVEHLMRRVEALDSRVNDNIDKTDAVITKLRTLDLKLFHTQPIFPPETLRQSEQTSDPPDGHEEESVIRLIHHDSITPENLGEKLLSLDQKVSDIDDKLVNLKNQLDNNFLPSDDINAEASEKKPISMNVIEITKAMSNEVMNHITIEIENLRQATGTMDKKLQFHMNLVSETLGSVYTMTKDIHEAIVDKTHIHSEANQTTTTPVSHVVKRSKIDRLVEKIYPVTSVSEKMDQIWNIVVGTKSSVDHLLPKSDELLIQTHRQEREINAIHSDLQTKTNQIIENLEGVESRLKKHENDVANLVQRPIPAELLLDPTIDRLVEYDPNRYIALNEEYTTETSTSSTTTPVPSSPSLQSSSGINPSSTTPMNSISVSMSSSTSTSTSSGGSTSPPLRSTARNRGVIFPSVKNKPSPANSTFTTDNVLVNYKDIKGYSCVDLFNAGMRESGVYYLQIRGTTYWFLKVYCEQEIAEGGWTVIQRRDDFGDPRENFNRDWADYKNGFGDPAREFWLGNENIYMLTNNEDYSLRVELEDFEGNKRYAQYSHFKIYSEGEYYKLEIDGYEGNAGDSLNDPWYGSNNSPFSTYNRDNDRSSLNCASMLKGGWWWKSCGRGLNGLYLNDPQDLTARQGIVWFRWRGWDYTLKKAIMMIKPKGPISMS
ncbi:fibrinogen alpha chain isoform X2 [Chelonus insularis]|uniref:fibrinogen alpha chain isoform X2 n=1 Tax=Chelonus insularis TaxID=460826 RepID=UPI00158D2A34|nr:fibrinogen alpha chain isoform X2 [Chelonus insularis]